MSESPPSRFSVDEELRQTVERIRAESYPALNKDLVAAIISAEEQWIDDRARAASEVRSILVRIEEED